MDMDIKYKYDMLYHVSLGLAGWYKLQLLGTQHTAKDHQSENAARSQPQPVMATIGCTERCKQFVLKVLPTIRGET